MVAGRVTGAGRGIEAGDRDRPWTGWRARVIDAGEPATALAGVALPIAAGAAAGAAAGGWDDRPVDWLITVQLAPGTRLLT